MTTFKNKSHFFAKKRLTKSLFVFYNYFKKDVYCDKKGMILMGRYLAVGIPAQINIIGKRKWDKSKLEIIKKEIGKYTDLSLYEETLYSNGANYKLKKDVFKKNIYQALQEFKEFTSFKPSLFLEYLNKEYDLDYSKLNQKDYP